MRQRMTAAIDLATKIIKIDEESNVFKPHPYYCSLGYPTIGWGFLLVNEKNAPLPDITMTREEGDKKLENNIAGIYRGLTTHQDCAATFKRLNDARQAVLISMCYQLGMVRLLGFQKMWRSLFLGEFNQAADNALDSLAARQTPDRWHRNADAIRTGTVSYYYLEK